MQALEEQMCKGINLPARDESEDEDEVEENDETKAILNLEEEAFQSHLQDWKKTYV